MTVRRALESLTGGGRIYAVRGKGTFIAQPRRLIKAMSAQSFSEAVRSQGRVPSSRVVAASLRSATEEEASLLEVAAGDKIFLIERVRLGDGSPLCFEHATLRADLFPDLLGQDLSGSLYELLERRYDTKIWRASFRVSARLPEKDEIEALGLTHPVPCLDTHTVSKNQHGVVVESTCSLLRGDRYEFALDFE